MPVTVFYSWQSDTDPKANRNFIEAAFKRAIRKINADAELVSAARDELQFDKDTVGLPGTPAIVDAIFDKIDRCAVFVPDVTFVATTKKGRPTPNANVMIEYGWALKSRGHHRIVPVMNEAFGRATETDIPFNMRHRTWPIRYNYDGAAAPAEERTKLVDQLAAAIRTVVESAPIEAAPGPNLEETPSTYERSVFFDSGEILVPDGEDGDPSLSVPERGPKMFLRLLPTQPTRKLSVYDTYALLAPHGARLEPLRLARVSGGGPCSRNKRGALVYGGSTPHHIEGMTQLLKNRELWGISCELSERILPSVAYEDAFVRALASYFKFAKEKLQLELPLKVRVGFTGIGGFRMAVRGGVAGETVEPDIVGEIAVEDWNMPPKEILLPFFKQVWEAFGLERQDQAGARSPR
jgi:hypothetical protein